MANAQPAVSQTHTTCSSLLHELQIVWDEIGESDSERDKMLLQLEQECLDIYRRKVDKARKYKADLHQSLAESEAEIANLISALGERTIIARGKGSLKEQLSAIQPVLHDLRMKKSERRKEFSETQLQIAQICAEIAGNGLSIDSTSLQVNECDLTLNKLAELQSHLQELQNEKLIRLQRVNNHINTIHQLSVVMSFDFFETVSEIDPSLSSCKGDQAQSISNDTLARLTSVIHSLKQEKQKRLQKLQNLGSTLLELWNLMDTAPEEQRKYDYVTSLISSNVDVVSSPGSLALEVIEQAELEVERLNMLKASKMKELVLKRQSELEEIYRGVHMDVDSDAARQILISLIESGNADMSDLLSSMDDQIAKAKEQALSRKDILDKVEKWKYAVEEEKWLDDYEKDENRYSAGRGAHKSLKRAEKARTLVSKIPCELFIFSDSDIEIAKSLMVGGSASLTYRSNFISINDIAIVETLTSRIKTWELEKGIPFLYDKDPLLCTLEQYTMMRQEREEEKRRFREQKRLQEQLAAEQEAIFGSRPKKPLGQSTTANTFHGTPIGRRGATPARQGVASSGKERRDGRKSNTIIPINYVALPKDDAMSQGN